MSIEIENPSYRRAIINEILGEENKARKEDAKTRFEVWKDKSHKFVKAQLEQELSPETVKDMPIISSINLTKAVVREKSAIYSAQNGPYS